MGVYDEPSTWYPLSDPTPPTNPENFAAPVMRSLHLQADTPMAVMFFSRENMNLLQLNLRSLVKERTGHMIDRQSDESLIILQRAILIEYMPTLVGMMPRQAVTFLNEQTLARALPTVVSNIQQYLTYLRDASRIPEPLPRGQNVSIRGTQPLMYDPSMSQQNPRAVGGPGADTNIQRQYQ